MKVLKSHSIYVCLILLAGLLAMQNTFGQKNRNTRDVYISNYRKIAVEEMLRSGIPASITLAQGMLESDNGNSSLATEANNHFGIKCHKTWNGEKVYHDDDKKNECFRKYNSADESYRDHTDFLKNTNRYSALFSLKNNDYKGWAKGLREAGYATSRTYADDLIRIIEENNLYKFDEGDLSFKPTNIFTDSKDDKLVEIKVRKIYERNRIKFVFAEEGDNIEKITKDMEKRSWEIAKYNEFTDSTVIKPGDPIYLQPKRWSASKNHEFHFVKSGETMHEISQLYGMKLSKLYRKNRMEMGKQPEVEQKLWLRSRKPTK
jgi:hypothetical protein